MRIGFYPKLAVTGMQKNKRLYLPFLLTCTGMAAMHYIIAFLANTSLIDPLPGSDTISAMLSLGSGVIAIFSVIFLFYTNSFLIRRRKKEFGLYNILGMGKRNIGHILFWEMVLIAVVSLGFGLGVGIALSKLAELGLTNIMGGEVSYRFSVSVSALSQTVLVFCGIFILLLLNALRQVHLSNPMALFHSENTGEKPPKANWFLGILGALILAAAYWMAVSIQDPLAAIFWFFIAVIMVIIATYLLFISGSVLLCRILQKKTNYYYKANHFVSVSSMVYRMKRNGAGLASICILATMVLVMISSSSCLYFGEEDSLNSRYPRDIVLEAYPASPDALRDDKVAQIREQVDQLAAARGITPAHLLDYRYASVAGFLENGVLETDVNAVDSFNATMYDSVNQIFLIPLADYNQITGTSETLEEDQVLLFSMRSDYTLDTFAIRGAETFRVKKVLDDFFDNGLASVNVVNTIFLVVPDFDESVRELAQLADYNGNQAVSLRWYYGFDTELSDEAEIDAAHQILNGLVNTESEIRFSIESREQNRQDFYSTYGGLFFLGIMLSIVFLFATVLIIYYKQICEGYEDQSRFEIMQKVGMTKKDIRRSINSQMFTVFFLPLVTAVVHLAFAFPLIRKLLLLFNMTNVRLFVLTTGASILVFTLFYVLVYRITTGAYYSIVSDGR